MEPVDKKVHLDYDVLEGKFVAQLNIEKGVYVKHPDPKQKQSIFITQLPEMIGFTRDLSRGTNGYTYHSSSATEALKLSNHVDVFTTTEASHIIETTSTLAERSKNMKGSISLPRNAFGKKAYSHVLAGVEFIEDTFERGYNPLIADEMGLGKTIQSLGYLSRNEDIKRTIVICPAVVLSNWLSEAKIWLMTGDQRFSYQSPYSIHTLKGKGYSWDNTSSSIAWSSDFKFTDDHTLVIMSYDIMKSKRIQEQIEKFNPDLIIADEVQMIKNISSARSRQFIKIATGRKVICLSGTPASKIGEWWPVSYVCAPKDFYEPVRFKKKYKGNPVLLHQDLAGKFMMSRRKDMLETDMPAQTFEVSSLDVGAKPEIDGVQVADIQPSLDRLSIEAQEAIEGTTGKQRALVQRAYTADLMKLLRQLDQSIEQQEEHIMSEYRNIGILKVDFAIKTIEEYLKTGKKMIVGFYHPVVGRAIAEAFPNYHVYVDGTTPKKHIGDLVNMFNWQDECQLFVGSIVSAGVGINLHYNCNFNLMVESYWTWPKVSQWCARIYRLGQKLECHHRWLVASGTIDEKVAKAFASSATILSQVLGVQAPNTKIQIHE